MRMLLRKKRTALLASTALLMLLAVLDVSFRKEEVFEVFGNQFENEAVHEAQEQANREVTVTLGHSVEIPSVDIKEVHLETQYGKIKVGPSADSTIRLQYTVTAQAATEALANNRQEAIEVLQENTDGRLSLIPKANGKAIDYSKVTIDYDLLLPDGVKAAINNQSGAVRIQGLKSDVDVTIERGMAEIVNVVGKVHVDTDFASVYLTDILGEIKLVNHYGDANMDQIKGSIALESQHGRTYLTRIEGRTKAETVYGSLFLQGLNGPVEVENVQGYVQLDQIKGNIQLQDVSGETSVILSEPEGYSLQVTAREGGRIWTQLPIPLTHDDKVTTLSGEIGQGGWKVEAEVNGGHMNFQYK